MLFSKTVERIAAGFPLLLGGMLAQMKRYTSFTITSTNTASAVPGAKADYRDGHGDGGGLTAPNKRQGVRL